MPVARESLASGTAYTLLYPSIGGGSLVYSIQIERAESFLPAIIYSGTK